MASTARGSIRRQIPGLVALVLALGVTAFGTVAYRAVRASAISTADARLEDVAEQFSGIFGTSFETMVDSMRAVATDARIVAALVDPEGAEQMAARAALARLGTVQGALRGVELRGLDGATLVLASDSTPPAARAPPRARAPDEVTVGRFFAVGDSVLFELTAPVVGRGRPLGFLVQTRAITTSADAVRRITELIGPDARLLLGNDDGSVWTDLVTAVDRPPPGEDVSTYNRDSGPVRSVSRPISGTPLHVALEFPEAQVLAAMQPLLLRFAGLAALVLGMGALGGWLLSRRLTRPLAQLAGAAAAIAEGDLTVSATATDRQDEIGDLATAFNVMAESVRRSRDHLEEQVAERTAELEETVGRLHEVQDELVRKERLATLGQLSGSVGHELRNPLGVMSNAIYYLEHVLTDVPQKVTDYIALLRDQIRTSEKIVSDLLDFARVKPPQKQTVDVATLVDDQLKRVTVPETVRVERRWPDKLPRVSIDPVQVGQVLLNLLTNGVQAMEEAGGVLTIAATCEDSTVRLAVSDSGPGVSAENRDKIFEPLFTTKARGIGLGLSVSRSLARANNGDLLLGDAIGTGATFLIDMPTAGGAP